MLKNNNPVAFGRNSYERLADLIDNQKFSNIFIICDTNTAVFCLPWFQKNVNFLFNCIEIPDGESHKNLSTLLYVWQKLTEHKADRKSLIINLGGGVVSDLGGFAASTYQRGITYVNFPTTLLAMVDAGIGGKTGIDFNQLKNHIGIIKQPALVGIDTKYLNTLSARQIKSGMAEVIKYGLISDKNLLKNLLDSENLTYNNFLVESSAKIKQHIVNQDPTENSIRKILNFGHTFGHALESHFLNKNENEQLLHGEAIAIGMIIALHLSHQKNGFKLNEVQNITNFILKYFPYVTLQNDDIQHIKNLIQFDKKNNYGNMQFVLLQQIGEPVWNQTINESELNAAISYYLSL